MRIQVGINHWLLIGASWLSPKWEAFIDQINQCHMLKCLLVKEDIEAELDFQYVYHLMASFPIFFLCIYAIWQS